MSAQQICDQIDKLFSQEGRSKEETLADMRQIADRAGMFAALDDEDDDFDPNFAYDDDDEDDGYDDIAA